MAVQDSPVRHLFDNTGDLYYGRGFEMLASLEANFKPAMFSHTFTTLLSIINDNQAEEGIHEFWAHFEGHLHDMPRLAISIPPILRLCSFYGHFILITKRSLTCSLQNRRTSPSPQSILSFQMHNSWMIFLSLVLMATLILSRMIY
jgi:hypothetical protein